MDNPAFICDDLHFKKTIEAEEKLLLVSSIQWYRKFPDVRNLDPEPKSFEQEDP